MSDNCDQNFGTFDDFGVNKNDQKVSNNMILMSKYKGKHGGKKGKKFGQGSPPPPFSGNGEEVMRAMPERKHFFMYPDIRAKHLGVKIYFYDMYKTQHFSFFPGIQSKHLREDTYFWDVCECETPHFQFYPDNCAKHLGAAGRIKIQKEGTLHSGLK